jgi:hypothetical protein
MAANAPALSFAMAFGGAFDRAFDGGLPYVVGVLVGLRAFGAIGCGSSEDECVDARLDCKPIVSPPTFDSIYANVLSPSCVSPHCHGEGFAAGLDMRTVDQAFEGLSRRSRPDSVGCSVLVRRIESSDPEVRMPRGPTGLSEPQRCAIRQWIANGAHR